MKPIHFILTIVTVFSQIVYSNAQHPEGNDEEGERHERIRARKVAIITERLNLSVDEAQKFWPVYNEFMAKLEEAGKIRKEAIRKFHENGESLTEKEIEELCDRIIESETETAALRKEYHGKLKKVLPVKKVMELYNTEQQFKRELLKEVRGGGHGRGPGPHRGPRDSDESNE